MSGLTYVGTDGRILVLPPGETPPTGARLVGPLGDEPSAAAVPLATENTSAGPTLPADTPAPSVDMTAQRNPVPPIRFHRNRAVSNDFPYSATDRLADTFPWSDEIRGLINGTARAALNKLQGKDADWKYNIESASDEARYRRDAWADENPVMNALVSTVGLASMGGVPALAGRVASNTGGLVARLMARDAALARLSGAAPTTVMSRARDGLVSGAISGAIDAAGNADGGSPWDRTDAGLTGAITGGTAGEVAPFVTYAMQKTRRELQPLLEKVGKVVARNSPIKGSPRREASSFAFQDELRRRVRAPARDDALHEAMQRAGGFAAGELADAINSRGDR